VPQRSCQLTKSPLIQTVSENLPTKQARKKGTG
jgi:hypothetical protein